jgi:hypothetical protein
MSGSETGRRLLQAEVTLKIWNRVEDDRKKRIEEKGSKLSMPDELRELVFEALEAREKRGGS